MSYLIDELTNIKHNSTRVSMKYIVKVKRPDQNEYIAFDVPLAQSVPTEIKTLILDNILSKVEGLDIAPFNPTHTEIGLIECLPVSEVNNFNSIHSAITNTLTESVSNLNFEDIWGYSISIKYGNNQEQEAIFFKKFSYPKLLKKSILLALSDGVFNKVNQEVVTVDNEIHAFSLDDTLYILNKGHFERFFNFSSRYQQIVHESMDTLERLNVIENFNQFASSCLNSDTLTRRLVKIISDARFETLSRNIANVPTVIDDFALNVKFENNKIVYDEESPVSDIITLIKGACVIGALDQSKYIASDTKLVETR